MVKRSRPEVVGWTPTSKEDFLLDKYLALVGGDLYLEVPIGGAGGEGKWPLGCTTRRLDGVRLYGNSTLDGVHRFRNGKKLFIERIHRSRVELIEVKTWLDRYVIGQAIAGRQMFQRQYKVRPSRVVVLCREGDTALEWVCKREGIVVKRLTVGEA